MAVMKPFAVGWLVNERASTIFRKKTYQTFLNRLLDFLDFDLTEAFDLE